MSVDEIDKGYELRNSFLCHSERIEESYLYRLDKMLRLRFFGFVSE
jgi:hypothetical protein